ncbi:MAG: chorismate mutase [Candidatus Mcinerneyibacterium aminivorans]|uniref:chorismate mutase n=1 Tax=Candidatus Mcinerneyibacterium aminivorans TaxID=2703815 RepID=A0A5D0MCX7_9BACT|nr:MAG: chorismate mutase [Candidatus Mcinerneyibacterium aminivorans]
MRIIRGAINLKKNSKKEIKHCTEKLMNEIVKKEKLKERDIYSIIISVTKDITKKNPCTIVRKMGFVNTALMGVQEMQIEKSMPLTIRFLIHSRGKDSTKFYYLKDTAKLRGESEK